MKPSEAEAPERIWAVHDYVAGMTNILSGHIMLEPTEIAETTEYVRADLVEAKIVELEAKLRKSALQELSALGQASEAYQAQLAAEAKLATLAELKGQDDE